MVEEVAAAVEKERSLISDADRRSRDCSSRADAVAKVQQLQQSVFCSAAD